MLVQFFCPRLFEYVLWPPEVDQSNELIGYQYSYFCMVHTPPSETIQVLELGSGYKILTINTTFYGEFFLFSKQTAATEPPLCHGVA